MRLPRAGVARRVIVVVCSLCDTTPVLSADGGAAVAVPPSAPTSVADLWVAPSEHVAAPSTPSAGAVAAMLQVLQELDQLWARVLDSSGMHVMGYIGDPRDEWPHHFALRAVGRYPDEFANPLRVLNGTDVRPDISPSQVAVAIEPTAVGASRPLRKQDRWDVDDPVAHCDCCNAFAVDVQQIATDGVTRLLQPMGRPMPGILLMSPVRHVERMSELGSSEFHSLLTCASAVRKAFDATVGAVDTYFFFNDGPAAGQSTPHLHVHLHGRTRGQPLNPFRRGGVFGIPGADLKSAESLKRATADALAGLWPVSSVCT